MSAPRSAVEELVRAGVLKRAESIRALDRDYPALQRERLLSILRQNSRTEFGRAHGFETITSVEEFQRRIPVSGAADYAESWRRTAEGERDILFSDPVHAFGLSSGTTGDAKLIPLAKGLIRGLKRAIGYATSAYMAETDNYSLLRGYALQMAAPTCVERLAGEIPVGFITGIIGASRTYPFHQIGLPPVEVLDCPTGRRSTASSRSATPTTTCA
ncbi:MAG: GH3 auxin-responsive promoter family protein [Planctomycetes bacterium]|nr:GH3 auxin-responsive promoter family protein [Planctomycetota bacterium]